MSRHIHFERANRRIGWMDWLVAIVALPLRFTLTTLWDLFSFFTDMILGARRPAVTDPRGDVARFRSYYTENYAANAQYFVSFFNGSYNEALREAKSSLKMLVVFLHNPSNNSLRLEGFMDATGLATNLQLTIEDYNAQLTILRMQKYVELIPLFIHYFILIFSSICCFYKLINRISKSSRNKDKLNSGRSSINILFIFYKFLSELICCHHVPRDMPRFFYRTYKLPSEGNLLCTTVVSFFAVGTTNV
uniref:PKD_channel domain-containing protein n=1 Tax=Heterorhabditis bacteriophora TaxID=37862 RepID=A0A1I7X5V4_HETBA